jgi:hypothetical protein
VALRKKSKFIFFHFFFFFAPVSGGPVKKVFVPRPELEAHTFSAFWLRSSVVSVLISLISGTWRMASHEFK